MPKLEHSGCTVTCYTWRQSSGSALHSSVCVLTNSHFELERDKREGHSFCLSEENAVNEEDLIYFQRWDVEVQMWTSHLQIIKLMSYTVSTLLITMFTVQLEDDMALFWVVLNTTSLLVYCEEHLPQHTHLNVLVTPFYAHQNYDLFPWIALWKPNTVTPYFIT